MSMTNSTNRVIAHPVSSSQLTQDADRVRPFGAYNNEVQPDLGQG
jgi:hypothetical protein